MSIHHPQLRLARGGMFSKKVFLVAFLLIFAEVCFSQSPPKTSAAPQERPDLNGEWVMDPTRSKMGRDLHDYFLTIVHRGPEISFSEHYWHGKREVREELIYYTDKRADIDPKMGHTARTETRWVGNKLVHQRTSYMKIWILVPPHSNKVEFVSLEEWSLSDDRQTLTRTITGGDRDSGRRSTAVFTRVK